MARGDVPTHPKHTHTRADLTSAEAKRALEGVDVLWHLGAQLWRSRDGRQRQVNLEGTENVIGAHPGHVVLASSAAVYGAHPDNPLPITEDHPPRPNDECPYAWHKLEAERMCFDAGPTAVTRISAVLGPHADPLVIKASQGYKVAVPTIRGVPSALQFLDEDDAAAGLLEAGIRRYEGVLNLATADWMTAADIATVAGGRVLPLPRRATISVSEVGYRVRLLPFGADRSSLLNGPLALDPSRAASALAWKPRFGSAEVLGRLYAAEGAPVGR